MKNLLNTKMTKAKKISVLQNLLKIVHNRNFSGQVINPDLKIWRDPGKETILYRPVLH